MLLACTDLAQAAENYCSYGHGTAVLLVDRTTAFDKTDQTLFLQALDRVVSGLEAGDRLVLFTMTGAYTESQKLFDECRPGCPELGFFEELLATCRSTLARSEMVKFTRQLAGTLAGLLKQPEETRFSDLFRTVAEAVRPYSRGPHKVRTLIMFSDLIENSTLLPERDLKRLSPSEILQRLRSSGVTADLEGATVRVFGFGRDDSAGRPPLSQGTRQRIADAWRKWFETSGADSIEIGFR